MKTFAETIIEQCPGNEAYAKKMVKILEYNGINSMDILMKLDGAKLITIKGIGDKAVALLGRIKTRELMLRAGKKDIYQKACGKKNAPATLRDYIIENSDSYQEGSRLHKLLVKNHIRTIDIFMKTTEEELQSIRGFGDKRLGVIFRTKNKICEARSKKTS